MNKQIIRYFAAILLLLPITSLAITHPGSDGKASSFVVTVYDPDSREVYYKDLGITWTAFLEQPQGIFNLKDDAAYAPFIGKTNLLFNVAAFSPLASDLSNRSTWGIAVTQASGSTPIANANWVGIDAVRQTMMNYFSYLTAMSGVVPQGLQGNYGSAEWNQMLNGLVAGSIDATVAVPAPFFVVMNPTGPASSATITKIGSFTLNSDGTLAISGSKPVFGGSVPVVKFATETNILTNTSDSLDGSASYDPNGLPLTYGWTQTAGAQAKLSETSSAIAKVIVTKPGSYAFKLSIGNGSASSSGTLNVNAVPILINAPQVLVVGRSTGITWYSDSTLVKPGAVLSLQYAVNGKSFKKVGAGSAKKGVIIWKPTPSDVSNNGVLKLCNGSNCTLSTVSVNGK